MSIEYYIGTEGPTITVNSLNELWEALDNLHTQTIDTLGEDALALRVLEKAMSELEDIGANPI